MYLQIIYIEQLLGIYVSTVQLHFDGLRTSSFK